MCVFLGRFILTQMEECLFRLDNEVGNSCFSLLSSAHKDIAIKEILNLAILFK